MRKPKISEKRQTVVYFSILQFVNGKYGRFPFHRYETLERAFHRAPVKIGNRQFNFEGITQ